MKINNPTEQQKANAENKSIEEHHAILFMIGVDKYRLGKLTEEMINDILSKKDPITKIVAETSHVLCEWMNHSYRTVNLLLSCSRTRNFSRIFVMQRSCYLCSAIPELPL